VSALRADFEPQAFRATGSTLHQIKALPEFGKTGARGGKNSFPKDFFKKGLTEIRTYD